MTGFVQAIKKFQHQLTVRLAVILPMATAFIFFLLAPADSPAAEAVKEARDRSRATNRLADETSPYLQQHATNPVNWYPWGKEAFDKAKSENKPIFLSIGYSTCHWCHVMERESFADEDVAKLLNAYFVSIKVDREERPDIDRVYMAATQAITGKGGWPNTVFLTPDKKPFYAGTYFPKESRWGLPGLMELLPKVAQIWQNDRQRLLESADQITASLVDANDPDPGTALDRQILDLTSSWLFQTYDPENGGFGQAPKFPTPHKLIFLLRHHHYRSDRRSLEMAEKTLLRMRLGGIYDHIGFGFHRYSTDALWRVPHFEKMLYDQALLAMAYTEAYQATGKAFYARTAREILTYILRDMTSPEGGFYSAEDADSDGIEGKFYLWQIQDVQKHLGTVDAEMTIKAFNLKAEGNFSSPEAEHPSGSNILYLSHTPVQLAADWDIPEEKLRRRFEKNRMRLLEARNRRARPFKDDKILTDWNGLMIAAMAKAGRAFDESQYVSAAENAADFIIEKLQDSEGRLLKRYRRGKAGLPAHLDDYAFFVWGLLELYESRFNTTYLDEALRLTDHMITHFWDEQNGGFFMTADDGEQLLIRSKQNYDGAIPSGNSVAALNLLRMGHITGRTDFFSKAERITRAFSASIEKYPPGHAYLLMALEYALNPSFEVVIAGRQASSDTQAMLNALRRTFTPAKVVLFRPADPAKAADIIRLAPYTEHMVSSDGRATAYVCTNFVCQLPTTDITRMLISLQLNSP